MVETDRISFHKNRMAYGITLDDVAKKAGLAVSTVGAYERFTSKYSETRTRDENAARIENALQEVIQEKLAETFINAINTKKEEKEMDAKNVNVEYDRAKIGKKIRKYCEMSNIGLIEFCRMCDIGIDTFSDSRAARSPYVYPKTLRKICKATGWSVGTLIGPDDIPIKKPVTTATYDQKNYIPPEGVCKTSNFKEICDGPVGEMFDIKYICQDGKYFREYKCVHVHKDELTKEQFINQITKEEK